MKITGYSSNLIGSSDAHEMPKGISEELRQIIRLAKKEQADLVHDGDLANLLPLGLREFIGSRFLQELDEELDGYPFYLVSGNHDPYSWLVELFKYMPNVHVAKSMIWDTPVGLVEFRHGHRWAVDWRFLRHVAPPIVEWMTDHMPRLWYRFSKWMGWIPSLHKVPWDPQKMRDYRKAIMSCWMGAAGHAHRHQRTVACGHTHCDARLGDVLIDMGTLKDREFVWIRQEIEQRKL